MASPNLGIHLRRFAEDARARSSRHTRDEVREYPVGLETIRWYVAPRENVFAQLEQMQLSCPLDGCPAICNVELTVDPLDMGAGRARGDHECLGDFWHRTVRGEQVEHLK